VASQRYVRQAANLLLCLRIAKELGPIFRLDLLGAPVVFVSGFDLVDELSNEKRFDKAVRGSLRRVRAIAGDGRCFATMCASVRGETTTSSCSAMT
jgi:cytochrome P450